MVAHKRYLLLPPLINEIKKCCFSGNKSSLCRFGTAFALSPVQGGQPLRDDPKPDHGKAAARRTQCVFDGGFLFARFAV
jgi:hypothetical protein